MRLPYKTVSKSLVCEQSNYYNDFSAFLPPLCRTSGTKERIELSNESLFFSPSLFSPFLSLSLYFASSIPYSIYIYCGAVSAFYSGCLCIGCCVHASALRSGRFLFSLAFFSNLSERDMAFADSDPPPPSFSLPTASPGPCKKKWMAVVFLPFLVVLFLFCSFLFSAFQC